MHLSGVGIEEERGESTAGQCFISEAQIIGISARKQEPNLCETRLTARREAGAPWCQHCR